MRGLKQSRIFKRSYAVSMAATSGEVWGYEVGVQVEAALVFERGTWKRKTDNRWWSSSHILTIAHRELGIQSALPYITLRSVG